MSKQEQLLKKAFPSCIENQVDHVLNKLTWSAEREPSGSFHVVVDNETLEIPYRGYWSTANLEIAPSLPPLEAEVVHCLYTRHHDGFVRERCLRNIIASNHSWVPAYVIKLLGEYVVEILQVIEQHLDKIDLDVYKGFLSANRGFYEKTKQRVASYWDCYYRRQSPHKQDHVGFKIVQFFDHMLRFDPEKS